MPPQITISSAYCQRPCMFKFCYNRVFLSLLVKFTIQLGYANGMRRYPILLILLLSFLLPLHVAASNLLSAQTCPAKSAMAAGASVSKAAPDCCDESNKQMDCQKIQSCHGCNISCQLFTAFIHTFTFSSDTSIHSSMTTPALGLFDPASVWRPPTNS